MGNDIDLSMVPINDIVKELDKRYNETGVILAYFTDDPSESNDFRVHMLGKFVSLSALTSCVQGEMSLLYLSNTERFAGGNESLKSDTNGIEDEFCPECGGKLSEEDGIIYCEDCGFGL